MVNKMLSEVSIDQLIRFVHNDLPESEMDNVELFLQENDLYADIADGLIDLVKDKQFSLFETKQYLSTPIEPTKNPVISEVILEMLNKKYNHLKVNIPSFKNKVKSWFTNNIQFKLLKPVPAKDVYLLSIFESNNNKPVIEKGIKEAEIELLISVIKQKLHPGIYYWRMQSVESGAMAEGQFYVNKALNPFD